MRPISSQVYDLELKHMIVAKICIFTPLGPSSKQYSPTDEVIIVLQAMQLTPHQWVSTVCCYSGVVPALNQLSKIVWASLASLHCSGLGLASPAWTRESELTALM